MDGHYSTLEHSPPKLSNQVNMKSLNSFIQKLHFYFQKSKTNNNNENTVRRVNFTFLCEPEPDTLLFLLDYNLMT